MNDNFKITSPIQHHNDNSTKIRQAKDMPILNPVDAARVTPKNNSENSQNTKNNNQFSQLLNHNSVFNRFINQLSQTPSLSQTLKKLMFEAFVADKNGISTSKLLGKTSEVDDLLTALASKLDMNPEQIVEALHYQSENQTKFGGKMFDMLRKLLSDNRSTQEFENLLGKFLKSYNGYHSVSNTAKSILQNLKGIAGHMPKTYQDNLTQIIDKIITHQPSTSLDINLSTLKNEVIPFLSHYISQTNDFGKIRDAITLLVNNIARLDSGSRDDIVTKFVDLLDFCKFHFDMSDEDITYVKNIFVRDLDNPQTSTNELFDSLTKLLAQGSDPNSQSPQACAMYRDIVSSLLLDNSVFMPLTHLFLPLNYNGTFMFSEVWIDKDANPKNNTSDEAVTKVFVTFDIKGIGYFEATVWLNVVSSDADVELSCPESLVQKDTDIKNNVAQIIAKNGFSLTSIAVIKGQPPQALTDIFKKTQLSRRGIDVVI